MATINIIMTAKCAGGDHATIRLTKGAQVVTVPMNVRDLRQAITQDDIEVFAKVAIRLLNEGKTLAQLHAALQTGFEVVV